ncbi:MAG TPA: hypothetical protein VD928_02185 [Candidatus Paceibacterota bacterium]|nr:hypothetical protein [Candidatus Paceibacterota bacterium]
MSVKSVAPNLLAHYTIEKLRSLKPGAQCIYYRGNMANDLGRCVPDNLVRDYRGAPTCRETLIAIQAWARVLEVTGRVKLLKRERLCLLDGTIDYEYVAEGITRPSSRII